MPKRCACPLCIIQNPEGRDIPSSLYWRHSQKLDLKRKLDMLDSAEQDTMRSTVKFSHPHLARSLEATASETASIGTSHEPPTKVRKLETAASETRLASHVPNFHGTPRRSKAGPSHHRNLGQCHDAEGSLPSLRASLQNIVARFIPEVATVCQPSYLEFSNAAAKEDAPKWEVLFQEAELGTTAPHHKRHFLLTDHPVNHAFAHSELMMRTSLDHIKRLEYLVVDGEPDSEGLLSEIDAVKTIFRTRLTGLLLWKRDIWCSQLERRGNNQRVSAPNSAQHPHVVNTGALLKPFTSSYGTTGATSHPLVTSNMVSVLLLNLLFGLSHRQCGVLLTVLRHNLSMAAQFSNGGIPRDLGLHLPKSLDTIIHRANIDPTLHQYITCPACHALYPSTQANTTTCSARIGLDGPPCLSPLHMKRRINGKEILVPIRSYFHHDAKNWVGRLLCRGHLEKVILANQEPLHPMADGSISDILGSKVVRELMDSDGLPFLRRIVGEYRLVFALSVDGFNPFGNREAKQTRTCTGIYLICLNLPLSERQKPENMFLVGVIPGPNKPKEGEVNSYLKLLVDDFLPFWNPGVRYSSTPSYQRGALCKGAIIAVVCDGLGARDISGLPPITSTPFCIYCELGIHSLENFDYKSWVPRTLENHRRDALIWRDANPAARDQLRKKLHPARYSALLELPYFDPITLTAIDTMHNMFLGLFQRHCRYIWGMNIKLEDGDGSSRSLGSIPSVPDPDEMEAGRLAFATVDKGVIRKLKKGVLYYLCDENGLRRAGNKGDLLKSLCTKFEIDLNAATRYEQPRELELPPITAEVIEQVQSAELKFSKGQSVRSMKTVIIRCMCFLRASVFHYANPSKAVMVEDLYDWRTARQRQHLPLTMDLTPLRAHLAFQGVLSGAHSMIAFSSRGTTPSYSRQSTPCPRPASISGSRAPTPRPAPSSSSRQSTPVAQVPLPDVQHHGYFSPSTSIYPQVNYPAQSWDQGAWGHAGGSRPAYVNGGPTGYGPPVQHFNSGQRATIPHTGHQYEHSHNYWNMQGYTQNNRQIQGNSSGNGSAQGSYNVGYTESYPHDSGRMHGSSYNWEPRPAPNMQESQQSAFHPRTSGVNANLLPPQDTERLEQPVPLNASITSRSTPSGPQPAAQNSRVHSTSSRNGTVRGSSRSVAPIAPEPSVTGDVDPPEKPPKRSQSAVLGSGVLAEYALDRQNMILPPWITKPPAKAGHPEHGKLSADQWRVLCSVNLPITLIRLWGVKEPDSRWYKMLTNFLDLVNAVEIASKLSVSSADIDEYEERMHSYLTTMVELYPDAPVTPNHHIALHVGGAMRRLGPTPGCRTYGTERFNLNLQRVNTNGHSGEIEMTMTKTICRAGNLIALIEDPDVKPFLGDLSASLAGINNDQRGSRVHDAAPSNDSESEARFRVINLDATVFEGLRTHINDRGGQQYIPYLPSNLGRKPPNHQYLHTQARSMRKITLKGVHYHTFQSSIGASHVVVRVRSEYGREVRQPAQIQQMFRHSRHDGDAVREETFLVVKYLQPLPQSEASKDPYRRFHDFGSLWKLGIGQSLHFVSPSQIVCHFARTELTLPSISTEALWHVLPLDKMRTRFETYGWVSSEEPQEGVHSGGQPQGSVT